MIAAIYAIAAWFTFEHVILILTASACVAVLGSNIIGEYRRP